MHSTTVLTIFLGSLALSVATDGSSAERRQDNSVYASALQLGYNPAQASYYAAAITQGAVASAFNELNAAGVLAQIAPLTSDPAQYNSKLDAGIASLPAEVQAAATSFFVNINNLNGNDASSGHTFLTVPATTDSGAAAAASTTAAASPKTTGTNPGSLILASVPPSLTASAVGSSPSQAGASGVATTITANASSKISSGAAPARTGWAFGAVAAGVAGLAMGL